MAKKETNKKHHDVGKIATRILAAVLAGMMVFAMVASLIMYLI